MSNPEIIHSTSERVGDMHLSVMVADMGRCQYRAALGCILVGTATPRGLVRDFLLPGVTAEEAVEIILVEVEASGIVNALMDRVLDEAGRNGPPPVEPNMRANTARN